MQLKNRTTKELIGIVFLCLRELKERHEKAVINVIFKQCKGTLVMENGIPADRKGWLYLPFLSGVSGFFQPKIEADGATYCKLCNPGTKLLLSGVHKSTLVEVTEKNTEQTVEIDGAFIAGQVRIIK